MWDIWRETLGAPVHMYLADLADSMERAKNCVTWKRPWASRAVMLVLTTMAIFSYVVPAIVFQRLFGICIGVQFFFLAPLQLRYQRYRRMVWVVDCLLWHCPTDVELAADTLYTKKLCRKSSYASEPKDGGDENTTAKSKTGPTTYLRTVVADMVYAYNPLSRKQRLPITILQTASSTSLDRLVDETEDAGDISAVHEALLAGKRLGRKFFHGSGVVGTDDDRYTGLGGDAIGGGDNDNSSLCLPSMMGLAEEREWMRKNNLFKPVSRTYSVESLLSMYKGDIATSPIDLQHTRKLSDASVSSIPADNQPTAHMAAFSEPGLTATNSSSHSHEGGIHSSLYAFRCIHNGKYGTLFVTADRFVFRRSRIMGGRRSSVSSYLLSSVVAIRKSTGHFGKSHGIQILLNDGVPYYFYGLPSATMPLAFYWCAVETAMHTKN
ncbi:hypothetical protein BX661DRAFT_100217 [Kickxella alabastrina]|uniref:uncharacterized protein n=1 Tax=Kickxella alabastrina TaxID=61397 RepID=UPI00221EA4F8|nr:uncharacterized protein BX661DRAFT_100217 [Kickxella alabastrina]KAI7829126.1 hypothetical protein BX661DRAFT_100217 [Kickxella alabastrina]